MAGRARLSSHFLRLADHRRQLRDRLANVGRLGLELPEAQLEPRALCPHGVDRAAQRVIGAR
jgi:hypothetical protein